MTPEKVAALEAAAAAQETEADAVLESMLARAPEGEPAAPRARVGQALDEDTSPVVGRRFSRN